MYRDEQDAAAERAEQLERKLAAARAERYDLQQSNANLEAEMWQAEQNREEASPPIMPGLKSSEGVAEFVWGIVSIFFLVTGPIAWIKAHQKLAQMNANNDASNRGLVKTAKAFGITSTLMLVAVIALFIAISMR